MHFAALFYDSQLLCNFRKESFNRLRVVYNNACRLLLNISR
jgi:hypothetical protein